MPPPPNHALQRTRPSRSDSNPRVPRAGSLSFCRSAAEGVSVVRRQRFLIWLTILFALWVVVNWPRAYLGALKSFLVWAGLPWQFAHWEHGRLVWFHPMALAADVTLGVAIAVPVSLLCAWSRRTTSDNPRRTSG
jgi:hypothetical protein